jgi:hypothetical protein
MSYLKERIPALIEKYKKNIDYLEGIIGAQKEDELDDEKVINIIKSKQLARIELIANYTEVDRLDSIRSGKDLEKDDSTLHPSKKYALEDNNNEK